MEEKDILNALKLHYSLLPAFDSDDAVRDAILSGVKVTGITITYMDKIVFQYPIFVQNDMHYDDLKQNLEDLGNYFLPIIADKLLKNEIIDIQNLLPNHNCGGCEGCKK